METLEYYKRYLERELKFPIEVTGWEDFSWEEFYLLGPGDKREYEALKRTRAIKNLKSTNSWKTILFGLSITKAKSDPDSLLYESLSYRCVIDDLTNTCSTHFYKALDLIFCMPR